jgi:hypothetical protein
LGAAFFQMLQVLSEPLLGLLCGFLIDVERETPRL